MYYQFPIPDIPSCDGGSLTQLLARLARQGMYAYALEDMCTEHSTYFGWRTEVHP